MQLVYAEETHTADRNPVNHSYGHVGRYFNLGSDAEVKKLFPEGFPKGVKTEFDSQCSHMSSM